MSELRLTDLEKSFEERRLFSGLSYAFPSVGLFLIEGDSGTGKTTLLRMIAGLDNNYRGSITGGGAEAVSFAFQEHRLFPTLSALANVAEILYAEGLSKQEALTAAGEALLAVGLPTEAHKLRPAALSGGMRQRVSLARAFASSRPILLLDEPEKELDEGLREQLAELICREALRRLVLVVTHTPARLAPFADGILTIGAQNP